MLLGELKCGGVCWLEVASHVCDQLVHEWPEEARLATGIPDRRLPEGEEKLLEH